MKKITTLMVALTAIFTLGLQGQNAWINEIHYDNASTDVNEVVEVIIENPGSYTLSLFQVDLYNGSGGAVYGTHTLDGFTAGATVGNFTIYYKYISGIQNGAPDGLALSYNGTLISGQFLSYEGTFDGVGGPADGVTSSDIGVAEGSATLDSESLQLTGSGTQYSAFNWTGPVTATVGALNTGQSLSSGPLPEPTNYPTAFAASASGNMIETSWTDATGAQLPGAYVVFISELDNIVAPVDGTPVADDLDLSDGAGAKNVNYGQESYTFMNLATTTQYYFAIYPYTNGGATIDYKTDGTAPEASATTTSVVMYEDFNWSWMAWQTISVVGDQLWTRNNNFGPDGTPCAYMNGYSGGAQNNEDWLISPPMNLGAYTGEVLTFYTAKNFSGPDLEVKYSNNYDGGGNPASATWTDLSATLSSGGYAWTHSGNISLSGVSGSAVYIAFVYNSTTSGAALWEVDNVLVTGSGPDPEGVVINEIMYNSSGTDEEWIELYNNTSSNIDISGWYVQDNTATNIPIAIPGGTILSPGQYYTISVATDGAFPFVPDLDGTLQANWSLNNTDDDVNLFNLGRLQADFVPYTDSAPWPTEPDGNGPSLSLLDPDLDNSLGENWARSIQDELGSPGSENFPPVPTILVTSPAGGESWEQGSTHEISWNTIVYTGQIKIELIDTNTWFPQLLVSNISSSLNSWTWNIFSTQALGDDYIIRISDLGSGPVGESPNTFSIVEPYVQPPIVITEIMYNPPESGNDSLEFIELYNNGSEAVDMTGFTFSDGVNYTFPSMVLNPAEYVLISIDSLAMLNTFGVTAYQWSSGALSNSGELIQLLDGGGMFVDSVHYDDALPWDSLADGFGPSLTFCDPSLNNALAENWTASTEFAAINANGDTIFATPMAGCSFVMPTANFKAADTTVLVGGTADFTDLSSGGTMISWLWTFEGGTPGTSTEQNPTGILYDTQGAYDVTLEVENDFGETSTLTRVDYISVDYAPVADFEADATNPAVGQEVNFTDLSTGTITSWSWTFEGGTPPSSMLQTPEPIVYAEVGLYDVTLTVANDYGEDTMVKDDYIDVHPIGISEPLDEGLISIYPNPVSEALNIVNRSGGMITISIHSLSGQQVIESRIPEGTTSLNVEQLEAGLYFVRYLSENNVLKTGKLVVR
jgi:PKD repeat protein